MRDESKLYMSFPFFDEKNCISMIKEVNAEFLIYFPWKMGNNYFWPECKSITKCYNEIEAIEK